MMNVRAAILWGVVTLGALVVGGMLGCSQPVDPAVLALREQYLLTVEPTGAIGILKAREQLAEQPIDDAIVVLGRVGMNAEQTWDPGKAAFVITDLATKPVEHSQSAGHDPDNCPFCKSGHHEGAADPTALVRVVDDQGHVVPVDARKLFGLNSGQTVVVRATPSVDKIGNLVLTADGIYLRR